MIAGLKLMGRKHFVNGSSKINNKGNLDHFFSPNLSDFEVS
jgi:hypothetical protein